VLVAAAALSAPPLAAARQSTTAPSKKVVILVVITNAKASLYAYKQVLTPDPELIPIVAGSGQKIQRGDEVVFNVLNHGRRVADFSVLGRTTSPIKPGHRGHLTVAAIRRGKFPYRSRLDRGKTFRGTLAVA
jgi:hypothetical protein